MIIAVYGEPIEMCDYKSFTKTVNRVPVMCLIQNSKEYREFTNANSEETFFEYRQIRNSIRGWAIERKK